MHRYGMDHAFILTNARRRRRPLTGVWSVRVA